MTLRYIALWRFKYGSYIPPAINYCSHCIKLLLNFTGKDIFVNLFNDFSARSQLKVIRAVKASFLTHILHSLLSVASVKVFLSPTEILSTFSARGSSSGCARQLTIILLSPHQRTYFLHEAPNFSATFTISSPKLFLPWPNFEPSKFLYEVAQLFTLLRALVCQIIYCFYNMVKNWPAKHFGQRICRTCFFLHLSNHASKHFTLVCITCMAVLLLSTSSLIL